MRWDLGTGICRLKADGASVGQLKQAHPTGNGLSYLRLRSTAAAAESAGFLVDHVRADIDDPVAPARTAAQNREMERKYIELLEGHRDRRTGPKGGAPNRPGKGRRDPAPVG